MLMYVDYQAGSRAESRDPVVYGGPVQNRNYSVNLNFDVFFMFVYHSNRTNLVCG